PELFYTIETLDEAIGRNRKVAFAYVEYGTDKKQHKKCRKDGTVREYVVSPYQMAAKDGKYYLICNYDKYNDISNYRIDRIKDIKILEERAKPFEQLEGSSGQRLDLAEYMAEHIYMYSSKNSRVKFRIVKPMISDVIDIFGMDVRFANEMDTHVDVYARVTEEAMFQFAKNYAPGVLVLEPKRLVDRLREDAEKTFRAYNC
ncbi:MAG: WYL domain-containing protein, partial [Lachnospiraceae bacterium]|nr:WYL domain-containing protein [Lachnospiraceae bacterium]